MVVRKVVKGQRGSPRGERWLMNMSPQPGMANEFCLILVPVVLKSLTLTPSLQVHREVAVFHFRLTVAKKKLRNNEYCFF